LSWERAQEETSSSSACATKVRFSLKMRGVNWISLRRSGGVTFPPRLNQKASDIASNLQRLGHSSAMGN
jgi:hypothetical protein